VIKETSLKSGVQDPQVGFILLGTRHKSERQEEEEADGLLEFVLHASKSSNTAHLYPETMEAPFLQQRVIVLRVLNYTFPSVDDGNKDVSN
jgi:hypothetical protein